MKKQTFTIAALLAAMPVAAQADDCPSSNVCASRPDGVVAALQSAGYKATLGKAADGTPKISSAANGYNYNIYFYDCKAGVECKSLQFKIWFSKEAHFNTELTNKWNLAKRFLTMAFDPNDQEISLSYDVSTVGGLNPAQFVDTISWWDAMLSEFDKFNDENKPKSATGK